MQSLSVGISMVRPFHRAVFPYSNSIYVDGSVRIMVDAGSGREAYQEALKRGVDLVLLTHYHFDHTNGLEFFNDTPVMAGAQELWAYSSEEDYESSTGYHLWDELMDEPRKGSLASTFKQPEDVPVVPGFRKITLGGLFHDQDSFNAGNTCVQAIHTPGHTPGHYSFFFPKEGILFAGDYDLSPWGPWYGALVSDFDQLVESVEKLIALQPRIIVSSHRQQLFTEDPVGQLQAFLAAPIEKEKRMLDYLAKPRTLQEIFNQEFVHLFPPRSSYSIFWNRMMAKKHLDRLLKKGCIIMLEGNRYVQKGGV